MKLRVGEWLGSLMRLYRLRTIPLNLSEDFATISSTVLSLSLQPAQIMPKGRLEATLQLHVRAANYLLGTVYATKLIPIPILKCSKPEQRTISKQYSAPTERSDRLTCCLGLLLSRCVVSSTTPTDGPINKEMTSRVSPEARAQPKDGGLRVAYKLLCVVASYLL